MNSFASFILSSNDSGDFTPNVPTLHRIPIPKSQLQHKSIHQPSHILNSKVSIERRWRRESVADGGRDDDVIRESRGRVLGFEER